jgi:hypothetical protein
MRGAKKKPELISRGSGNSKRDGDLNWVCGKWGRVE